jgi:hypothetical protein
VARLIKAHMDITARLYEIQGLQVNDITRFRRIKGVMAKEFFRALPLPCRRRW